MNNKGCVEDVFELLLFYLVLDTYGVKGPVLDYVGFFILNIIDIDFPDASPIELLCPLVSCDLTSSTKFIVKVLISS